VDITKKIDFKHKLTNFFGGLGYFSCAAQWFWVILLYFSYFRAIMTLMAPIADTDTTKIIETLPTVTQSINPLAFVVGSIIVITVIAVTIFVIIKMPSTIAKTGQKLVHKSSESILPIALRIQKKKETKKNKIKLNFSLILIIKILIIIIPIILTFTSQFIKDQTFDFDIAMYVSVFLLCLSSIFFCIQYVFARLFAIDKQNIL